MTTPALKNALALFGLPVGVRFSEAEIKEAYFDKFKSSAKSGDQNSMSELNKAKALLLDNLDNLVGGLNEI